jgi:hypothetical protein
MPSQGMMTTSYQVESLWNGPPAFSVSAPGYLSGAGDDVFAFDEYEAIMQDWSEYIQYDT